MKSFILPSAGLAVVILGFIGLGLSSARSNDDSSEKQEVMDRLTATYAAAVEYADEHPDEVPVPNPTVMPTVQPTSWSVGIVDSGQAPISSMQFLGTNAWSWDINGYHVVVYAGSEGSMGDTPGRGILLVLASTMDLKAVPSLGGWYEAPLGTGALQVVNFEGTQLTVEAETGETFYFDAESREFTDAEGNPVPTDTPTPTPWPSPPEPSTTLPPFFTEEPVASADADTEASP